MEDFRSSSEMKYYNNLNNENYATIEDYFAKSLIILGYRLKKICEIKEEDLQMLKILEYVDIIKALSNLTNVYWGI